MYDQIRYPSDNSLGIPTLKLDMQAKHVVKPCLCWGSTSRNRRNEGMWHFYTDDYRWNNIIKNPDKLIKTKPSICTELNITLFEDTPPALALAEIFKKRWVSRHLQEQGVQIIVDLFVPQVHLRSCILIFPKNWKSYSTRGTSGKISELRSDYNSDVSYAGTDDILFVAYKSDKIFILLKILHY